MRGEKIALEFRTLTAADAAAFERARLTAEATDPNFARGFAPGMTFEQYLARLEATSRGENLPPDHVPSAIYFAFISGEIVGRLMFRRQLNARLLATGGTLGYVVLPEWRGKGIATEMLRRGLEVAKAHGLERALLTCDEKNLASRRVIEKCAGVLENVAPHPDTGAPFCRYWITL